MRLPGTDCALSRDQDIFPVMLFPGHVVVMTVRMGTPVPGLITLCV